MFVPAIQDILAARLQQMPQLIMERDLSRDLADLMAGLLPAGAIAVVDDETTKAAYGARVALAAASRYDLSHITLPYGCTPDEASLARIEQESKRADLLVAVGSGTISDLTKFAAHRAKKPYVMIPTAASMNGYLSASASLSMDGRKQSLAATLPVALWVDMSVIAAAPARLSQAGLGDSLARPTAQADWLLSHHVGGSAYDAELCTIGAPYEEAVFAEARGVAARDAETLSALMKLLLVSGLAMTLAGSSAPASGAEHMIAHAYSMSKASHHTAQNAPRLTRYDTVLHGEEIALLTPLVAGLQERLLRSARMPELLANAFDAQAMGDHFSQVQLAGFESAYEKKRALLETHILTQAAWDALREEMSAVVMAANMLTAIAESAGLPQQPEALGWSEDHLHALLPLVRFTRERITCLDVKAN